MAELSRSHDRITDMLAYLLTPLQSYLDDPMLTDLSANSDGTVWIKHFNGGWEATPLLLSVSDRRALLDILASRQFDELTADRPSLSTVLPSGARVEGSIPPLAEAPTFAIRVRARRIFTLEDFCQDGILTDAQGHCLRHLVQDHRNLIIAGPTGSAKSTLMNALIAEIDPAERVILLEDTPELQVAVPNVVTLWTREGVADLRILVRKALRMQPDRILIGEVRGAEALDFLKALNTGHRGGMTTLHAEHTRGALIRLEMLVQEAAAVVSRPLIGETVDVVVTMASITGGQRPRVLNIDRVQMDGGDYQIDPLGEGEAYA